MLALRVGQVALVLERLTGRVLGGLGIDDGPLQISSSGIEYSARLS